MALEKGYGFTIDQAEEGDKITRPESLKAAMILEAEDIDDDEFERLDRLKKMGETTTEENDMINKHYRQIELAAEELDEKQLKYFLSNEGALERFLALIDLENKWTEDTAKCYNLVEKVGLAKDLMEALGFSSVVDDGRIEQETFMMNFVIKVLENPRFKHIKRINELFGLSKKSRPSTDMTVQRMVNWVNRIMKTFSLELKMEKGSGDIYINHLGDIVELVRRKNATGRYYEDEGNLLNLKRRPAPRDIDTSMLDVFIDDDGDDVHEQPMVEVPSQVQAQVQVQVQAARSEPGYHGNLDLNIDEDDAADEPIVKKEPQVLEKQQRAAIKPKKERSSRFIPDFDW